MLHKLCTVCTIKGKVNTKKTCANWWYHFGDVAASITFNQVPYATINTIYFGVGGMNKGYWCIDISKMVPQNSTSILKILSKASHSSTVSNKAMDGDNASWWTLSYYDAQKFYVTNCATLRERSSIHSKFSTWSTYCMAYCTVRDGIESNIEPVLKSLYLPVLFNVFDTKWVNWGNFFRYENWQYPFFQIAYATI